MATTAVILTMPHFAFYKPYGTLSQFVNNGRSKPHHKLIGDWGNFPSGTMAIGRLDRDSEGLLLLTTDGRVSEYIRANTDKEYWVQVDGVPTQHSLDILRGGVTLSHRGRSYQTRPCAIHLKSTPDLPERSKKIRDERHGPTSWISITLTEGKFRQIRKMTAAIGHPTLRLVRTRVGHIDLGDLQPGKYVEISILLPDPD